MLVISDSMSSVPERSFLVNPGKVDRIAYFTSTIIYYIYIYIHTYIKYIYMWVYLKIKLLPKILSLILISPFN